MMVLPVLVFFIFHVAASESSQCSDVALRTWCSNDLTLNLAQVHHQCGMDFTYEERRCRTNEQGQLCGLFVEHLTDLKLAKVACSNQSYCSTQCHQLLQQLKNDLGCCINVMLNTTDYGLSIFRNIFDYELWQNCSLEPVIKECQPSRLAMISKSQIANGECSSQEFYQRWYQTQCSNTKIKTLAEVYNKENCNQVSEDLYEICSTTEDGVWCVEHVIKRIDATDNQLRAVQTNCSDAIGCSPACKNELLKVKSFMGCCMNMMINNTFIRAIFSDYIADALVAKSEVWSKCDVTLPKQCDILYYNGRGNSVHASATAIIIAIILNNVM